MKNGLNIQIKETVTIAEIQRQFNRAFPYLKLEFFESPHKAKEGSHKSKMIAHDRLLRTCRSLHNEGELQVIESETVSKLERDFWEQFGLSVQVFRKSGNLWIETSLTDSWTLKRQNEEGKEFSSTKVNGTETIDLTDRDQWE